jgi:hypothetical protein
MTCSDRPPARPGQGSLGQRATLGNASSPALVRELKGNGCVERLNGSDDTSAGLRRPTG